MASGCERPRMRVLLSPGESELARIGSRSALNDAHGDAAICTDDVVAVVSAVPTAPVSQACTVVHAQ